MTKVCIVVLRHLESEEVLRLLPGKHTSSDGPEGRGGRRHEGRKELPAQLGNPVLACLSAQGHHPGPRGLYRANLILGEPPGFLPQDLVPTQPSSPSASISLVSQAQSFSKAGGALAPERGTGTTHKQCHPSIWETREETLLTPKLK